MFSRLQEQFQLFKQTIDDVRKSYEDALTKKHDNKISLDELISTVEQAIESYIDNLNKLEKLEKNIRNYTKAILTDKEKDEAVKSLSKLKLAASSLLLSALKNQFQLLNITINDVRTVYETTLTKAHSNKISLTELNEISEKANNKSIKIFNKVNKLENNIGNFTAAILTDKEKDELRDPILKSIYRSLSLAIYITLNTVAYDTNKLPAGMLQRLNSMIGELPELFPINLHNDLACERDIFFLYQEFRKLKNVDYDPLVAKTLMDWCHSPYSKLMLLQEMIGELCTVISSKHKTTTLPIGSLMRLCEEEEKKLASITPKTIQDHIEIATAYLVTYQIHTLYSQFFSIKKKNQNSELLAIDFKNMSTEQALSTRKIAKKATAQRTPTFIKEESDSPLILRLLPDYSAGLTINEWNDIIKKDMEHEKYIAEAVKHFDNIKLTEPHPYHLNTLLMESTTFGSWLLNIRSEIFSALNATPSMGALFDNGLNKKYLTYRHHLETTKERIINHLKPMIREEKTFENEIFSIGIQFLEGQFQQKKAELQSQLDKLEKDHDEKVKQTNEMIAKLNIEIEKEETRKRKRQEKLSKAGNTNIVIYKPFSNEISYESDADQAHPKEEKMEEVDINENNQSIYHEIKIIDRKLTKLTSGTSERLTFLQSLIKNCKLLTKEMNAITTCLKRCELDMNELNELGSRYNSLLNALSDDVGDLKSEIIKAKDYLDQQGMELKQILINVAESLHQKFEIQRYAFIMKLGEQELQNYLADEQDDKSLSPEQIYSLGWERFISLGRANRENGKGPSETSLNMRFLTNFLSAFKGKIIAPEKPKAVELAQHHQPVLEPPLPEYHSAECILPEYIKEIAALINTIPGDCYIVGSTLIDIIKNKGPILNDDLDLFSTCVEPGKIFECEIDFHRSDKINNLFVGYYKKYDTKIDLVRDDQDSSLPLKQRLSQNAYKRSFTINSLFCDIKTGYIFDFTGLGLHDIENRILRMPHGINPLDSFNEDPTRILDGFKKILRGFRPTKEVCHAILAWQPAHHFDVAHCWRKIRSHLSKMSYDSRLEYIELLKNYNLISKFFAIDEQYTNSKYLLAMVEMIVDVKSNITLTNNSVYLLEGFFSKSKQKTQHEVIDLVEGKLVPMKSSL